MNLVSIISLGLLYIFCSGSLFGQDATFSVELSQDTVLAGEQFKLTYKITDADANDFNLPDLSDFLVVAGPNVSSSMSIINGTVNQEASYSVILISTSPGDHLIPAVELYSDEKLHTFEAVKIHILENPNSEFLDNLNPDNSIGKESKKKRKTYKI